MIISERKINLGYYFRSYRISITNKKIFFELSIKHRKNFVEWIGKISNDFTKNYLWWIKLPSSRDPYKSNLFKNIIILFILKDKKLLNKIDTIIFENKLIFKSYYIDNKIDLKKVKVKFKKKRIYLSTYKINYF